MKSLEDKYNGLKATSDHQETEMEALRKETDSSKPSVEVVQSDSDLPNLKLLQEGLRRNQEQYPTAGSCEILHRCIKPLLCEETYSVLDSVGFECSLSVVRGFVKTASSPSSFKGTGTSKKKAKNNAFNTYLSFLLNMQ